MNLALLNPFRQADRIDSTLTIPRALHPPRPKKKKDKKSSSTTDDNVSSSVAVKKKKDDDVESKKKLSTNNQTTAAFNNDIDGALSASSTTGAGGSSSSNTIQIIKKPSNTNTTDNKKLFAQNLNLAQMISNNSGRTVASTATTDTITGGDDDNKEVVTAKAAAVDIDSLASMVAGGKKGESVGGQTQIMATVVAVGGNNNEAKDTKVDDDNNMQVDDTLDTDNIINTAVESSKDTSGEKDKKDEPTAKEEVTSSSLMDIEMKDSNETSINDGKKSLQTMKKVKQPDATVLQKNKTKADHQSSSSEEDDDDDDDAENYWTACYAVSFNRRGSLLASGHASGLIPIHDFMGRTMSALYNPPPGITLVNGANNGSVLLTSFVYSGNDGSGSGGSKVSSSKPKEKPGRRKPGPKPKNPPKEKKKNKKKKKLPDAPRSPNQYQPHTVTANTSQDSSSSYQQYLNVGITTSTSGEGGNTNSIGGSFESGGGDKSSSKNYVNESAVVAAATNNQNQEQQQQQVQYMNGVTSLSWDRRSRTVLGGAIEDKNLRLMDNTHPLVSTECTDAVRRQYLAEIGGKDVLKDNDKSLSFEAKMAHIIATSPPMMVTVPGMNESSAERISVRLETKSIGRARLLRSNIKPVRSQVKLMSPLSMLSDSDSVAMKLFDDKNPVTVPTTRHQTLLLELPQPLGGPVQLHPRDSNSGLACMIDGSLALFHIPPLAFYETIISESDVVVPEKTVTNTENVKKPVEDGYSDNERRKWVMKLLREEESKKAGNLVYLVPPYKQSSSNDDSSQYFITCAAFGKHGDVIWAVTKCGNLLAFRVDSLMMDILHGSTAPTATALAARPALCVRVPGGAAAWQIIVSGNGRHLLINSADCSLRLYEIDELSKALDGPSSSQSKEGDEITPRFVFQDNISKAPWASCDFSGDGEYVVGGCNSYPQPGDNYKLFLWNCVTGQLADQLTGPVSSLYSVSCNPTRPFIAVGTSDGIVDVWGARLDWVAFAPDFQALQQNEVYEEREDEFDIVVDSEGGDGNGGKVDSVQPTVEDDNIDITTISKVPAFDSDSEDETDVFCFDWKTDKILSEKVRVDTNI